ncbi:MAG: GtrA family protein [Clostridiales bacterium]|nr:GtrA family protein [Clostridiales bacterium]
MNRMVELVKKLISLFFNRETINYALAGVLTTIVNFTSYHLFCNILMIPNLLSNIIAWILAVTFAYIVNKTLVFLSKSNSKKEEAQKITKFFGARLVSLGVEELGLYFFVDRLHFPNLYVKAGLAIIVIIINYIFSKQYIFRKR